MKHKLTTGLLLLTLAAAALSAPAGEADSKRILRIPKMVRPPVLDGTINEQEWVGASAFTGFSPLAERDQYPADMKRIVYLGYDDKNLYLAMHYTVPQGMPISATTKNQFDRDNENRLIFSDHLEIQISPQTLDRGRVNQAGVGFYKIIVNPYDVFSDYWYNNGTPGNEAAWSSGATVKSRVDKDVWQLEMAIPITGTMKGLDGNMISNADGLELVMQLAPANFCIGYGFGSWVSGGWDKFYQVTLDPLAPAMQFLGTGELIQGGLDLSVRMRGQKGQKARVGVTVFDTGNQAVFQDAKTLALSSDAWRTAEFRKSTLDVAPYEEALRGKRNWLILRVEADGKMVYTADLPFVRHTPESLAETYGFFVSGLQKAGAEEWKSRLTASDPATWKPVPNQAAAPISGVTLDDAGVFKPVMSNNTAYLLNSFSVNHMLVPFRARAGQPQPPDAMDKPQVGFWETELRGSGAGRFLMGAGNTLRWSDNPELRRRLNELIDGIEACRGTNGYILPYPPDKPVSEEPNYARAWLTHGLIDAAIAGNPKAYGLLRGHADWFNQWDLLPRLLYFSNNNHQGHIASTRTYLSPVGKPEDLQVAEKYYVCDWWLDQLAAREERAVWKYPLMNPHSYLITSFEAYLDHYRATGDKKYLDAMLGAWDLIHDKWEHVGGAMAICEGRLYKPGSCFITRTCTGETCGSVFWIKFNQRLHQLFPAEEKYVGEIEKSIYNVSLANQAGNGGIRYHARLQGNKERGDLCNTCCEGQGTRLLGSLPEYIYSISADGLYVNLYEPSSIQWQHAGKSLGLTLRGAFPFKPDVAITVTTPSPTAMALRIRVPAWAAADMPISVNGAPATVGKPGAYAILNRTWNAGDTITFTLPMDFRVTRYRGADQISGHERGAIEYGPILLAAVGPQSEELPVQLAHDPTKPRDWLTRQPDRPLRFAVVGDPERFLEPYWLTEAPGFTCFPILDPVGIRGAESFLTDTTVVMASYRVPAAEIRYTIDGSEPTAGSLRYAAPFRIERTTTVKAAAFVGGQPVASATRAVFNKVPCLPPTIRPSQDGKKLEIVAALSFPQGEIHYTVDGSDPTTPSPRYAGPLDMPAARTIVKAKAIAAGGIGSTTFTYVVDGVNPPLPDICLSDLNPVRATAWLGAVKKDCNSAGQPLEHLGRKYQKGMGVYAESELVYKIKPGYERFVAMAAVDAAARKLGSVIYEVYVDEQLVGRTALLRGSQPGWLFDLPLPAGARQLRLVVTDAGDGNDNDQADWLNAGFVSRKK